MANILSNEKKSMAIGALVEGSSIRSVERMTGIHRDTPLNPALTVANPSGTSVTP